MKNLDIYYDFLVNNNIATADEINLVTNIIGYSEDSLNKILYAKIGYRSYNQVKECEPDNYFFADDVEE